MYAENLKKTVYVAKRYVDNEISKYRTPVKKSVNCYEVLPMRASADVSSIGTSIYDRLRLVGSHENLDGIKPLDRVYVNNTPPVNTDPLATHADYLVYNVASSPMSVSVFLRRRVEEDD